MRFTAVSYVYTVMLLMLLPGCGKLIDWGKESIPQGENIEKFKEVPQKHVRSVTVYDQFTKHGHFDALWLTDSVRQSYSNLYGLLRGKNEEQKNAFLRRQLEENNHFISFYVLSVYELPLGDQNSEWQLFLKINDQMYAPIEIKYVDLNMEYQSFFGKKYNRFKLAYFIKFDGRNINDKPLITPETEKVQLYFRSIVKEATLTWNIPELPTKIQV